jgi:hypothetical protein
MAVPVGTFGEILEGDERGRFVVVQDDRERSGGLLIITAASRELDGEVFDSWVLPEDLEGWFEEAGWSVAWDGDTASS